MLINCSDYERILLAILEMGEESSLQECGTIRRGEVKKKLEFAIRIALVDPIALSGGIIGGCCSSLPFYYD